MVSVLAANLVSTLIECTLFGMFLLLSIASLVLLARRECEAVRPLGPASRLTLWPHRVAFLFAVLKSPLIVVNILMILTISAHWVVGMHRLFVTIVVSEDARQATEDFMNLRQGMEVARTALLFIDMLLGDAVMAFRTWIVWGKDYRAIIVPSITIAGLIASGIGLLYEFTAPAANGGIFAETVFRWIIGYCVATLATNLYGTVMIAHKIWSMNRRRKQNGLMRANGSNNMEAMAIFVESAALYSAWATLFVVMYVTRSPLQSVGSGCGPAMIGIAFMLITVRVGLGWAHESRTALRNDDSLPVRFGNAHALHVDHNAVPLQTITLDISTTVEQAVDYALERKVHEPPPHVHAPPASLSYVPRISHP
ncbi:hypothetical protein BD413DRAFT_210180 [Trametes elegans]|nr:hypothetical protein BD413DRAFT_210180 [Trametes elegans]